MGDSCLTEVVGWRICYKKNDLKDAETLGRENREREILNRMFNLR